jgi:hypothetical protein
MSPKSHIYYQVKQVIERALDSGVKHCIQTGPRNEDIIPVPLADEERAKLERDLQVVDAAIRNIEGRQ